MKTAKGTLTIEARRSAVAEGIIARKPYKDMAKEHGVSISTIAGDVEALRKQWSSSYGKTDQVFQDVAMNIDRWLAEAEELLATSRGRDRLPVIDRLLKLADQKARLFDLYPRGTNDQAAIPTGPITLTLQVVEAGNKQLITPTAIEDPNVIEHTPMENHS